MKLNIVLLFFLYVCHYSESLKLLVVFPLPGKSHGILGDGYVRHLLNAGHEVTYITPYPIKNPPPNLRYIDVSENIKLFPTDLINLKAILNKETGIADASHILQIMLKLTEASVRSKSVQDLMMDTTQMFDLVITEWMLSELYSGFAAVFNCPYVWSTSTEPFWMVLQLVDEIPNPTYTASLETSTSLPFTFMQRVLELFTLIRGAALKNIYLASQEEQVYQEAFGPAALRRGLTLAPYKFMKYNASLMLGNCHVSMGESIKLPQSFKPIGGYHIDSQFKPLTDDLQKIMDNAKHGVIYFSMGSNLKSKEFPDELKKSIVKMFGTLKQTVLWKFEEAMMDLPKNVHILQWAPQQAILAHKNCRIFITHGGLLSTTETIHYGVPVIGIPVFADQFMNVARVVSKGFARKVDLSYTMADDMKIAIDEMIENPKYQQKVNELSLVYHDRPISPGDELVHWVQHVVKTNGAMHLRSPALMLAWYQKFYLDFATIVIGAILLLLIVVKRLLTKKSYVSDKSKKSK